MRNIAGVRIYHLRGEDQAPTARIGARNDPIGVRSEIGDDAPFFHLVEGARRLDDGRVVVASRGTNEITIIDSLERMAGTIGRGGRGPGEFARLSSVLGAGGDTLIAFDGQLRRITLFATSGVVIGDYVIEPPARASIMGLADVVGAVDDGRLVVWLQVMPTDEELERLNRPDIVAQVPLILFTVDSVGKTVAVIGEFPGIEMYAGTTLTPSGERVPANWGPAPFGQWTGFGVHGGRVYVFLSGERGVRTYSPDGTLLSVYRAAWPPRPVTADARTRNIDEWMQRFPAWPEEQRSELELVEYPEVLPAFRHAVVGSDGIIWIEPYHMWDGERRHYVGYDSTGLAIGRLSLDYQARILDIGTGEAVLLEADAEGRETIRVVRFLF